jgi:hypothetical protein
MNRPSNKELFNKIRDATEVVKSDSIAIIDPAALAADAIELGYRIKNLKTILLVVLDEIDIDNYAGSRPPQKSYKPEIKGLELFAFRWKSKNFGRIVYFKFCINHATFYLVSLHPDRSKQD